MMLLYDLSRVPNQSFTTNINGNEFEFHFRTFRGVIYASAYVNGELACAGARCAPNESIFPNVVNIPAGGVFMFRCSSDEYPAYEDFGEEACIFSYVPYGELG